MQSKTMYKPLNGKTCNILFYYYNWGMQREYQQEIDWELKTVILELPEDYKGHYWALVFHKLFTKDYTIKWEPIKKPT